MHVYLYCSPCRKSSRLANMIPNYYGDLLILDCDVEYDDIGTNGGGDSKFVLGDDNDDDCYDASNHDDASIDDDIEDVCDDIVTNGIGDSKVVKDDHDDDTNHHGNDIIDIERVRDDNVDHSQVDDNHDDKYHSNDHGQDDDNDEVYDNDEDDIICKRLVHVCMYSVVCCVCSICVCVCCVVCVVCVCAVCVCLVLTFYIGIPKFLLIYHTQTQTHTHTQRCYSYFM